MGTNARIDGNSNTHAAASRTTEFVGPTLEQARRTDTPAISWTCESDFSPFEGGHASAAEVRDVTGDRGDADVWYDSLIASTPDAEQLEVNQSRWAELGGDISGYLGVGGGLEAGIDYKLTRTGQDSFELVLNAKGAAALGIGEGTEGAGADLSGTLGNAVGLTIVAQGPTAAQDITNILASPSETYATIRDSASIKEARARYVNTGGIEGQAFGAKGEFTAARIHGFAIERDGTFSPMMGFKTQNKASFTTPTITTEDPETAAALIKNTVNVPGLPDEFFLAAAHATGNQAGIDASLTVGIEVVSQADIAQTGSGVGLSGTGSSGKVFIEGKFGNRIVKAEATLDVRTDVVVAASEAGDLEDAEGMLRLASRTGAELRFEVSYERIRGQAANAGLVRVGRGTTSAYTIGMCELSMN